MNAPEVCVLKTDGINCDYEMAHAFETAGAEATHVHVNELRDRTVSLEDFDILALPGGFSYGDDVASGKILATELTSFLADQLHEFVEDDKPILGICNGFQVLVKTGLLPYGNLGNQSMSLIENESGKFVCRWVDLQPAYSVSKFVDPDEFEETPVTMQVAHGEGRFYGREMEVLDLAASGLVVFRYSSRWGSSPDGYPDNPNGSFDDIAGITDPSGLILGMMPHPERSIAGFPADIRRKASAHNAASLLFKNIVDYARQM